MSEELINLNSGELKLEGLLANIPGDKGAVVSHPHPSYGGDMYNNVVEAICQAYIHQGFSTLRFNFRGVDRSEGVYDDGRGEQSDVQAAIEYLHNLGKINIDLAGYSFGAWVNTIGLPNYSHVSRAVLVSPPLKMLDFSSMPSNSKIKLVITGSDDEFVDAKMIKSTIQDWAPESRLEIIQGADHFYRERTDRVKSTITEFLSA